MCEKVLKVKMSSIKKGKLVKVKDTTNHTGKERKKKRAVDVIVILKKNDSRCVT